MVKLFEGALKDKAYVLKASVLALGFWLIQLAYQFSLEVDFWEALVKSSAFTGATLISLALIIGPLSKLTKINFLYHRRTLGVWGFTFLILHFISVMYAYFNFDLALLMAEPSFTILLFGIFAFWIYMLLFVTSTDWAEERLGFRKWKIIHRLVYFAYIFSIIHYVLIVEYLTLPKILLLVLTVLALAMQLAAFFKTISKTKKKKDLVIGLLIIAFGLGMFYAAFVLGLF